MAIARGLPALLLAVLAASAGPTAVAAAECKTLLDWTSPLYTALPMVVDVTLEELQAMHVDQALAAVDELYPALSRCLGSGDLITAAMPLFTGANQSLCLANLETAASSLTLDTTALESKLCPLLNETVLPCVGPVVTDTLTSFFATSPECCAEFEQQTTASLGQSLQQFILVLVRQIASVLCSRQTSASGGDSRLCAGVWLGSLGTERVLVELSKFVQLGNDQACDAVTGKQIATTTGQSYRFFETTSPVDSCFAPVNLMVANWSQLPLVADSASSVALFSNATDGGGSSSASGTSGACLTGLSVLNDARASDGAVYRIAEGIDAMVSALNLTADNSSVRTAIDRGLANLETTFGAMCLHLAHSAELQCSYASGLEFAFVDGASDIAPGGDQTDGSGSSSAAAPLQQTGMFTATVVAMALVLTIHL